MGTEYKLSFAHSGREGIERALQGIPGASPCAEPYVGLEFRSSNRVGMPDAAASAEEYGVYFCDNGSGQAFLGWVLVALVSAFESVQVSSLS